MRSACRYSEARAAQPEPEAIFHYLIVRKDLPAGLQSAYIGHAAGESNPRNHKNMHVVVLHAKDESELRAISKRLVLACVPHHPMYETDGEHAGQMLSLGVEPGRKEDLRRHLSSLPLLR